MSFDYDMFVINSENKDTAEYQLRDCIKDAFERLEKRLKEQEKLMEVMVDHLDTQARLNRNFYEETEKLKELLKPTAADVVEGTFMGNLAVKKALEKSCEKQVEMARKAEENVKELQEKVNKSDEDVNPVVVSKTENTTMVSAENAQTIEHSEDYYREHLNLIRRAMIRENGYEEQKKLNKLYWKVCDKYIEALISEFGGEE